MGHQAFTAEELVAAESARLIGCHGPNLTYQLTELGVATLEASPGPAFKPDPNDPLGVRNEPGFVNWISEPAPTAAKDVQVGGDHYKTMGDYQPWQVLAEWMTPEELRGYMQEGVEPPITPAADDTLLWMLLGGAFYQWWQNNQEAVLG